MPTLTSPAPIRVLPAPAREPVAGRHLAPRTPQLPTSPMGFAMAATAPQFDDGFGARPTSRDELPDPVAFTANLVRTTLEVLGGHRPHQQLIRWLDHDVYLAICRRAAIRQRLKRTTERKLVVVKRVRACPIGDNVVEMSVVAIEGAQPRAVAVRLEGLDGRWRATAVEIG